MCEPSTYMSHSSSVFMPYQSLVASPRESYYFLLLKNYTDMTKEPLTDAISL